MSRKSQYLRIDSLLALSALFTFCSNSCCFSHLHNVVISPTTTLLKAFLMAVHEANSCQWLRASVKTLTRDAMCCVNSQCDSWSVVRHPGFRVGNTYHKDLYLSTRSIRAFKSFHYLDLVSVQYHNRDSYGRAYFNDLSGRTD